MMNTELLDTLAQHQAEILAQLTATLRVRAMDNRGQLTSPRRAPQVAQQLGQLWFDILTDQAGSDQAIQLAATLVEQGLTYPTAAAALQTLRQSTLATASEETEFQRQVLLAYTVLGDSFLSKIAAGRELMVIRDQQGYQNSLQQALQEKLKSESLLITRLDKRQKRLRAVINIHSSISTLLNEAELLSRFAELTPTAMEVAGVAVLELAEHRKTAFVHAVGGQLPPSLEIDKNQTVPVSDNLNRVVTKNQLMVVPLPAADEPLKNQIIVPLGSINGAIIFFSDQANILDDDVEYAQPLTIVLAAIWQNARLLQQARHHLAEMEQLYGQRTREAWGETTSDTFIYDGVRVKEAPTPSAPEPESDEGVTLPIEIRNIPIGRVNIPVTTDQAWAEEDRTFAEAVIREIANALENANLIVDTQRRARREQTIREITEKMRTATSLEELVKTAAQELGQRFSAEYTLVELGMDETKTQPGTKNGR